jgi:acetylglutamate kinase
LSDVPGVLDKDKRLISEMTAADVETCIQDGTIHGGMIPKVRAALLALSAGVPSVRILSGRAQDPIQDARKGLGTRFHS